MSENSTAVACFRNQGIQRSVSLLNLSSRIWLWFRQTAMSTSVSSGIQNISFSFRSLFLRGIARLSSFKGKGIIFAPSFSEVYWFPYVLRRSKGHASLPSSMTLSQVTSRLYGLLRGSNIPNWEVLIPLVVIT